MNITSQPTESFNVFKWEEIQIFGLVQPQTKPEWKILENPKPLHKNRSSVHCAKKFKILTHPNVQCSVPFLLCEYVHLIVVFSSFQNAPMHFLRTVVKFNDLSWIQTHNCPHQSLPAAQLSLLWQMSPSPHSLVFSARHNAIVIYCFASWWESQFPVLWPKPGVGWITSIPALWGLLWRGARGN